MAEFLQIFVGLLAIAAYGAFWLVVFQKAGYETGTSILMTIGMFIPLVNLAVAFYFAYTVWPIQTTLSARSPAVLATEDDAMRAFKIATRLECGGDVAGAIAKYEEIVRALPGSEAARDAEAALRSLRAKIYGR